MARWIIFLTCTFLSACSSVELAPTFSNLQYDFQSKSQYDLTDQHKMIYVYLDAEDLQLPKSLEPNEALKLNWTRIEKKAQIAVYIRFSESFLVERDSGFRKEVHYNQKGRGEIIDIPIQRGFVRTHYNIELVDRISDSLINDYQGADNFKVEAPQAHNIEERRKLLKAEFYNKRALARQELLNSLLNRFQSHYLVELMVTFGKQEFELVSKLEQETAFSSAFLQLKKNQKSAALKALSIYNNALKKYPSGESDRNDQIRRWLDQGISAASAIANHQYEDRYKR